MVQVPSGERMDGETELDIVEIAFFLAEPQRILKM